MSQRLLFDSYWVTFNVSQFAKMFLSSQSENSMQKWRVFFNSTTGHMNISSALNSAKLPLRGTLLVALSGVLFGLIGYLGTQLFNEHFAIENMLFWRFLIATLWILFGNFIFNRKNIFATEQSPIVLLKILLIGTCTYSIATTLYFIAAKHIGTGLAMVIFFSFPFFVSLFAWFLSDWEMTKPTVYSLLAVFAGLILLKGQGKNMLDKQGIFYALMAAFFYAGYIFANQNTVKIINSAMLTLLVCGGNTIVFFIIAFYSHTFFLPSHLHAWLYIFAIGVFATALPIQFLLNGLKYISPIKASVLSVLEPTVTLLVGTALLHESITYLQFIGIVIVLLGAIFIQFEKMPVSVELVMENKE